KGCACGGSHRAEAVISGSHDNIVSVTFDGEERLSASKGCDCSSSGPAAPDYDPDMARKITVRQIFDFACNVPLEKIEFMMESVEMNKRLSNEGLTHHYGLQVGRTLLAEDNSSVYGDNLLTYAMACTAAASDARMAGCTLSAMSNSGSGNQGVTVTMPVISIAEKTGASHEQLMRAIALAHLVAIHIKGYLGRLSALCGCVIASTGASCGIVYLRGGGYEEICSSIKNMIGNITGMVCDGAKVGCALKVASGVACALQSAVLALEGKCISPNDGIIEEDIEKTISNLGRIGSVGMRSTDEMILDIMTCK
ncbi:MAG: serine dehydratase subunit alpha family protein, partial [Bacteroidales bacterium]|nr:serine dehydratase subunit alpha family protein [Bacteroidales bacterium]